MAVTKFANPEIRKLVREWRIQKGISRLELADTLGVSKTSVSNWELGLNEPGIEALTAMANMAGTIWGPKFYEQIRQNAGLTGETLASIAKIAKPAKGTTDSKSFVRVPLIIGAAGAGPPYWSETDMIEGYLSLPPTVCANATEVKCIQLRGDSMEPTIADETIVAVDGSQKKIERLRGKIVAARHGIEGIVIKRLVYVEDRYRLASDKPGYDPLELKDGWDIVGRVVWWIQTA